MNVLKTAKIADPAGKIPTTVMRKFFETAVTTTEVLRPLSLKPLEEAGKFVGYDSVETDRVWFGFALGLRCAERVEANGQLISDAARLGVADSVPTPETQPSTNNSQPLQGR